jgi:hypothetical protein
MNEKLRDLLNELFSNIEIEEDEDGLVFNTRSEYSKGVWGVPDDSNDICTRLEDLVSNIEQTLEDFVIQNLTSVQRRELVLAVEESQDSKVGPSPLTGLDRRPVMRVRTGIKADVCTRLDAWCLLDKTSKQLTRFGERVASELYRQRKAS